MSASVYELSANQITSYLEHSGWKLVNQNDRCYVFEGYKDVDDNPFEIILPVNQDAPDFPVYVEHTIRIVSALTDRSPEIVTKDILHYDRDVLIIRVDETPIDNASKQTPRIKSLIRHSANSERNVKPHFDSSYYSNAAKEMVNHFRLIQSINGASSYHVESRVGKKESFQRLLPFKDKPDPGEKLPLERRVMERIATGLVTLNEATKIHDVQPLIDGYKDGFNANMCDAILMMSRYSSEPIQFSVKWSRKIDASVGVKVVKNVKIDRRHHDYLKAASDKLKELKPEFQIIRGRVIGLSSLGDPQSDEVNERSIVVLWNHGRGRSRKLRINLERKDYLSAIKAHKDWATISVEGIALKRRAGWELADPQEFRITH